MKFEKWQACGNDFALTRDPVKLNSEDEERHDEKFIRQLCDVHYGIGADGIIHILPSEVADAKMRIFNKDGSEANMCGNGIRCVGRYLVDELGKKELTVETLDGVKKIWLDGEYITVNMGMPKVTYNGEIELPAIKYKAAFVNTGNQHCVLFLNEEPAEGEVERNGYVIENMRDVFPDRTNVEFMTIESRTLLRVRVWERGCGRTLACGTGAVASAYAAWQNERAEAKVTVKLDGGDIYLKILPDGQVEMSGGALRVYKGEL